MKLGSVAKLDKRNKTMSRKFDYDVMWTCCDVIVIFSIYGECGATWKLDSGRITCKISIFINSKVLSYKNWKQNWNISNTVLTLLIWAKVLFLPKNAYFLQNKKTEISKINRALIQKGIFSETTYVCVLMFQISRF